jgi:hypothetical protein
VWRGSEQHLFLKTTVFLELLMIPKAVGKGQRAILEA